MTKSSVVARESQHTKPTFKLGYCTAHAETNCKICHALTYDASDISGVCYNCLNGGHSICHEKHCRCRDNKHKAWWWVAKKSQHTQLPWHVSGGHAEYVEAANRLRVADCQVPQKPFMAVGTREMEANAEFIVRACNSHEKLVSALTELCEAAESYASSEPDMPSHAETEELFDVTLEAARQALRLAQGEK